MKRMDKESNKCFNFEEIKKVLGIPEFTGIKIRQFPSESTMDNSAQGSQKNSTSLEFSHIPEEIKASHGSTYATNKIYCWGDQLPDSESLGSKQHKELSKLYNRLPTLPKVTDNQALPVSPQAQELDSDSLSGYEEYMRTCRLFPPLSGYNGSSIRGKLRITPQATLSLSLGESLQVDMTVDGAIRIINPKAYIAMSVNGMGTHCAMMHPMGRVLQEASTVNILAYDMKGGCHKFAKLWPRKATFTSTDMSFSYTMDQAGTRTTMTAFPIMPSNDITLPAFYATSRHGPLYKEDAANIYKQVTSGIDAEGATVWTINKILIKYFNGDLRVACPSSVFLRTSVSTGHLGISTEALHCTASNGEETHVFVRFGANKMHYNGKDFKLRTLSQAAGFDENNRITLF